MELPIVEKGTWSGLLKAEKRWEGHQLIDRVDSITSLETFLGCIDTVESISPATRDFASFSGRFFQCGDSERFRIGYTSQEGQYAVAAVSGDIIYQFFLRDTTEESTGDNSLFGKPEESLFGEVKTNMDDDLFGPPRYRPL